MPISPSKPCAWQGCNNLAQENKTFCEEHGRHKNDWDKERQSASKRGYDRHWRKARLAHLRKHPLCAECLRNGIIKPGTDVDHIIDHGGDHALFWAEDNRQTLCHECHSIKTLSKKGKVY
ncbi:HNH endonuclease [Patescibacteria group bacterium]|nr:HNH endonuclease [Patescibacteria group bacterium]